MRPPSGVNLMAFESRLRSTWRTRPRSACTRKPGGGGVTTSACRCFCTCACTLPLVSLSKAASSTASGFSSIRPAAIRWRSSSSLISSSRWRPLRATVSRKSRCCSESWAPRSCVSRRSVKPMMLLRGVRSSWEMLDRNRSLDFITASRSAFSCSSRFAVCRTSTARRLVLRCAAPRSHAIARLGAA